MTLPPGSVIGTINKATLPMKTETTDTLPLHVHKDIHRELKVAASRRAITLRAHAERILNRAINIERKRHAKRNGS
jgi:predicted HicB family RNase H-like nuclease